MTELIAIDILIDPEQSMIDRAKAANTRMRQSVPGGFALDEHHQPHITTLQRYVRVADLDHVLDAVAGVVQGVDVGALTLTAVAIRHMPVAALPGTGLAGIVIRPGPGVLDYQARLIEAIRPYCEGGGTADAYVRTDAEPDINQDTIDYIERYVPDHSGEHFLAHVTVGLATLDDLKAIEAEPFEPLSFAPAGVSVYQLGNNGTAARHLRSWTT